MQNANYLAKQVVRWHLNSKSHAQATEEAHAACVEAQFPFLPGTQSLPSTMPRAARVSAALRAPTNVLPALLQASGDHGGLNLLQTAQETFNEQKKEWVQEREQMENRERKHKEQEDHKHEQ